MKEREYILSLYEIYKELLSDREKEYFENYYYEDFNLQEIADNFNVSKSYVGKYINEIETKLKGFENALKISYKFSRIRSVIDEEDNELLKIKIEEIL